MKILRTSLYFPCVDEQYNIVTDKIYGSQYCGGAESFIFSFAKYLSDRGIEVELFTFNPACKGITINFENVKIHYFDKILKVPFLHKKYIPLSLEFYKRLNNSDLIHCHGSFYHPLTDLACILKIFHKRPVIVTHHATQDSITIIHKLRDIIGIRFLKFVDKIIIPSKNSQSLYNRYLDKVEEIPLGTVTSTFKPLENKSDLRKSWNLPADVPIILFAGYLVHYKGVYKLIEAFEIVKRELSDALLIISGDGPAKDDLKSIVKKKDLDKSVVFLGRTLHSRMRELYNLSDLL
jgi:glycosyltransferase involved in cell wall biosynthesis